MINESFIHPTSICFGFGGMEVALLCSNERNRLDCWCRSELEHKEMALVLRGGEFIATEALSESTLARLSDLARRRPLVVNGLELRQQDLAELAEEAQKTGKPVWPRVTCQTLFSLS